MATFRQHFIKPGLIEAEYSDIYGNAFDTRLDSDYDMTATMDKDIAKDTLTDARRFVARAEGYLREASAL